MKDSGMMREECPESTPRGRFEPPTGGAGGMGAIGKREHRALARDVRPNLGRDRGRERLEAGVLVLLRGIGRSPPYPRMPEVRERLEPLPGRVGPRVAERRLVERVDARP